MSGEIRFSRRAVINVMTRRHLAIWAIDGESGIYAHDGVVQVFFEGSTSTFKVAATDLVKYVQVFLAYILSRPFVMDS